MEGQEQLTAWERVILAFEREWWRHGGPKDIAVREGLGMSPAQYHQVLSRLIDLAAAMDHDPLLVRRLRRLRVTRQRQRSIRRLARRSG